MGVSTCFNFGRTRLALARRKCLCCRAERLSHHAEKGLRRMEDVRRTERVFVATCVGLRLASDCIVEGVGYSVVLVTGCSVAWTSEA